MQKISALCWLSLLCLTSAQINIAPSSLNFGDVQIGQTVEKIAYIINIGDQPVTMSGVGGAVYAPFSAVEDCQNNVVGSGGVCRMYFDFTPNVTGVFSAVSQGSWNGYPFNISLVGNAVAPYLNIGPTSLDFGIVPVGEATQKITYITNVGDVDVKMSGVGGGLVEPFVALQNCQGRKLRPGDSCDLVFVFTPTTNGSVTATASGTWNDISFNITLTANTAEIEA
jgi:hypothetical protein